MASTIETSAGSQGHWGAVFAGAVCGVGLAVVLDAFGAAIGLAVSSTAPTWRDASVALAILSGIYLILTAVVSYGFGAFVAARLRGGPANAAEQAEMIDGYNGLIVWGLMTLATAVLILVTVQGLSRAAAPSNATAGAAQSVAGENIIAFDLDRLFRGARNTAGIEYQRAEAARILLTTSSHRGMQQDDRAYLARLVESVTGLTPADAQARVNDVSGRAKQNIDRARNNSVILAFMTAAAALAGAVAAWFASMAGGRERDGATDPWRSDWQWRRLGATRTIR
jgi:hypothetical protein